jgi:site-specific DNA-cytosine methylase
MQGLALVGRFWPNPPSVVGLAGASVSEQQAQVMRSQQHPLPPAHMAGDASRTLARGGAGTPSLRTVAVCDLEHVVREVPRVPLPPQPGTFHLNGHQVLREWIASRIEVLSESRRDTLLDYMRQEGRARKFGTMCSGTDCPSMLYRAYSEALGSYGVDAEMVQEFAVERDAVAQRFIQEVFGPEELGCIFATCAEAASPTKVARDVRPQFGTRTVATVHDLIAGFPCKDVSNLLQDRSAYREAIAHGTGRTGSAFRDILRYLEVHPGARSIILENVLGLGTRGRGRLFSNLDHCVHALEALGWSTACFKLDPRMFGMPVSRRRLWMISLRTDLVTGAGLTLAEFEALAADIMSEVLDCRMRDLDDFLLPETHPFIQAALYGTVDPLQHPARKRPRSAEWFLRHVAAMERRQARGQAQLGSGVLEPGHPTMEILDLFPGLRALSDRQIAVLTQHGMLVNSDTSIRLRDQRTIDVSQSAERTRPSLPGQACIVTPGSELFLYHRLRRSVGYEAMLLQGLHYGQRQERLRAFSGEELQCLAGNAFNGFCLAAAMLVRELLSAVCHRRAACATLPGQVHLARPASLTDLLMFSEDDDVE